jgi:hypothetical protein
MVEGDIRPFPVIMASATFGAITTLVDVVSEVTAGTFPGQWRIKNISLMTAVASDLGMPALERKTTCFGMVKGRLFPVFRLVALIAVGAKPAIVMIIELMAGITIRRNALVMLVGVAHRTFNRPVRSCQGKVRFPCVVEFSFQPGCFLMTTAAIVAEAAQVSVILLVTAKAVGRGLAK